MFGSHGAHAYGGSAGSYSTDINRVAPYLAAGPPTMGAARQPPAASPATALPSPPIHRTTQDDATTEDVLRTPQVFSGPHAPRSATTTHDATPTQASTETSGSTRDDCDSPGQPDPSWLQLPFPEFVRTVCDWIDSVQWFSADDGMFHLARAIKWHPTTAKLAPTDAWEATCNALVEHDIEQPRLGADLDSEDGAVDFCAKWDKVRFPFGGDPVELAFQEAGQGYLTTQTERPGRYSLFLTVAALLQLERGCRPILLPVHRLAELFDCRPMTVSAWLRWASEDGVLVKVAEHQFRPGGGGRAAEYLLGLHRWRTDTVRTLAARVKVRVTTKELQKLKSAFERRPDA